MDYDQFGRNMASWLKIFFILGFANEPVWEIFMSTQLEKERELLANIKDKSDDDYEKNITYIAAGTLVLSMTFIEKIVTLNKSNSIWILIFSWSVLVLTLLTNLISHQLSSLFHENTINEYDESNPKMLTNIKSRNRIIRRINWSTTFGLTLGLILLVIFCSINSIKMTNDKDFGTKDSDYIEKGRTITIPATGNSGTTSNSNNTSSDSSGQNTESTQTSTTTSDTTKK
ncbi:hypothetical protein [Lacibacter cauensis]|uniref:hypothetical protein n=1 Tax=Lacibacter cauensis TaxID=510947 RepID=UPI00119F2CB4|nr:hypothetical protein [Lacibacter cauensis]